MPIPAPNLDDLRFQKDLVDEARKRIIHYCPDWTEYNLSDPGITLIELFAWMIETLSFRINRVPEKNYIKFLDLLGLQFQPASSARTELTFWLSAPLPFGPDDTTTVMIPPQLEVRTLSGSPEEIVFSTDQAKEVFPPQLFQLRRDSESHRNYHARLGIEVFQPFQKRPQQGDTFFLGFAPNQDLSGHLLQLSFTCEPTEAVGIRRQDPPLVWECSLGGDHWQEIVPSRQPGEMDTTGGLNNPEGQIVLYLPLTARPDTVFGQNAFWLRCRFQQREAAQGAYIESPRIVSISAATLGSAVYATHAQVVEYENLGQSSGEPGQSFQLRHAPVLSLAENEGLEVEEMRNGEVVFVPWQLVSSFAGAGLYERCYLLEPATGTVELGPAVRQPDGTVRQYGRVPESDRRLRFRKYRYGGGVQGNLEANTLQTITSSVAYLARVNNLQRASGGRDQENLEELKLRAQRQLQAQNRAVTAQDFELLMQNFSRTVARVKCLTPQMPGAGLRQGSIEILVVPAVREALMAGNLGLLHLSQPFIEEARAYLDRYRLLTASVQLREPRYVGVQVMADIMVDDYSNPVVVRERVRQCLQDFLSPIPLLEEGSELRSLFTDNSAGWPFGKGLFSAEVSTMIHRVPGVKYVMGVRLFTRPVDPERETLRVAEIDPDEPLTELTEPILWLAENELICSLDHNVNVVAASAFQNRKGK